MRKPTIIFALIAAVAGVTGIAAAGSKDQNQSDTKQSDTKQSNTKQSDASPPRDVDDVHVTVSAGRGRLGFAAIQISPELRKHLGAPADRGVLVDNVRPDSPAARAGLRVGDVIVEVDGQATRSAFEVLDAISDRKKGDTVPIVVTRGKDRVTLQATLADNPGPRLRGSGELDEGWEQFDSGEFPFEMKQLQGDRSMRRALEDMRKRLEEFEQRMEELEDRGSDTKPEAPTQPAT